MLISIISLESTAFVPAESFEEEGRLLNDKSKLKIWKIRKSSTCTLPVGMQIAAWTCKRVVGIYEYSAAKTLKTFMGLAGIWISSASLGGGYESAETLGLWQSAFIWNNNLAFFFHECEVKLQCEWLLRMHWSLFVLLHCCRSSARCLLNQTCQVGADSSWENGVRGPLPYQTKPVPENLLCWLLQPLTPFHRAFPRSFEDDWM